MTFVQPAGAGSEEQNLPSPGLHDSDSRVTRKGYVGCKTFDQMAGELKA
jgi:hypothetical protein